MSSNETGSDVGTGRGAFSESAGTSAVARTLHRVGTPSRNTELGAWVVTRYADVLQALRDPNVVPEGTRADASPSAGEARRDAQRTQHEHAVWEFAERLDGLRPAFERSLRQRINAMLSDAPVADLREDLAEPWSRDLSQLMYGLSTERLAECLAPAHIVFQEAAIATSGVATPRAHEAASTLATALGAPHAVQGFVAISQTLPALLTNAWRVLLEHPEAVEQLRAQEQPADGMSTGEVREPRDISTARVVAELLRLGSPARAVFRMAQHAVNVGGVSVPAGDRLVLMLSTANHDPAQFSHPDSLDFQRETTSHLGFGAGAHRCVGESVVRLAVGMATERLLASTDILTLAPLAITATPPAWLGGFAIRSPSSLIVTLEPRR